MDLFNQAGEKASLEDVCDWIVEKYPADIFITSPIPIVKMREAALDVKSRIRIRK